jgi:hypothetical protein
MGYGLFGQRNKGNQNMLIQVALNTVAKELHESDTQVLLACIHPNTAIKSQLDVLEHVSKAFGQRLKVCLLCEEIPAVFGDTYGIEGTPTYLMISQNKVVDRLLGQVDLRTLTGFIERTLLANC